MGDCVRANVGDRGGVSDVEMRPALVIPGSSLAAAVEVEWPREEYEWLEAHPCLCGGAWTVLSQRLVHRDLNERGSRMTDRLNVRCNRCGRETSYFFVVQYDGSL